MYSRNRVTPRRKIEVKIHKTFVSPATSPAANSAYSPVTFRPSRTCREDAITIDDDEPPDYSGELDTDLKGNDIVTAKEWENLCKLQAERTSELRRNLENPSPGTLRHGLFDDVHFTHQ